MRIFCAVRHAVNPKEFYGGLWSGNFYPALRQAGHEIVESQTDLLPTSRFMHVAGDFSAAELESRAQTTESILKEVREAHSRKPLDLFLSYFYNSHFDPAGFAEIRRLGIPSVNYYCNSMYQFELVRSVAAAADFAWHAERDARQSYLDAGAKPIWVQMGADPEVYAPSPDVEKVSKSCFVGQRYADRDRWVAALIRAEVPVSLYGPGWLAAAPGNGSGTQVPASPKESANGPKPGKLSNYLGAVRKNVERDGLAAGLQRSIRQVEYRREAQALTPLFASSAHGAIPFSEIRGVFARHEVCLNFSNVWSDGRPFSRLIPHVRLRDFEAPMCRTCYLTGYTEEIVEFYNIGTEIDTYATPEELIDKTRFYLRNPEAAEKLREAGYRRARRDHTWEKRFAEVFQKIGLPVAGRSQAVN